MTDGQKRRSEYYSRSVKIIAREARDSFDRSEYDRTIRKTHECVELFLKAQILRSSSEVAKTHNLIELARSVSNFSLLSDEELVFLTAERIPAFYAADDFIPDEQYTLEDGKRCLDILVKLGL